MFRLFLVLVVMLALSVYAAPVNAQEPTETPTQTPVPTVTPTPSYLFEATTSTGSSILVQKTATLGDVAIVASVMALVVVELVKGMVQIPRMWIKK